MQNRISLLTSEKKKSTTFSTATVTLVPLHQAIFRPQIFYLVKIPLAAKSHSRPIRSSVTGRGGLRCVLVRAVLCLRLG